MDFEYNDEQKMFRKLAKDFVNRTVIPCAKDIDQEDSFPAELINEAVPLGFFGITTPQKYGGLGVNRVCYCVILEELAKGSAAVSVIIAIQNSFAEVPLLEWGTNEQHERFIARMVRGEILGCLGSTEPNHGSDPASMETRADRVNHGWLINGTKMFISNGDCADVAITAAQTDPSLRHSGIVAFIVERNFPGFNAKAIHGKLGLKGTGLAELVFNQCFIPDANVLGEVGQGFKVLMSAMDDARIAIGSQSVGISQACIDTCTEYVQLRQQFGKSIGSFQLIQSMIAEMLVETEAARLLTFKAAALMDKGQRGRVETSYCKLYASEVAQRVSYNAIQIHGGYGYINDYPLERYYRDARALTIVEGTSQIHKLLIGRHATGISAFV